VGIRCDTLNPQKLALTSPTFGGRSLGVVRLRTKTTEFVFVYVCLFYFLSLVVLYIVSSLFLFRFYYLPFSFPSLSLFAFLSFYFPSYFFLRLVTFSPCLVFPNSLTLTSLRLSFRFLFHSSLQ
jgi:hypothetical protein